MIPKMEIALCAIALLALAGCPDTPPPPPPDTASPVIALTGAATITIELGDTTTDANPGATVSDNDPNYTPTIATPMITDDTNPTSTPITTINTAIAGTYTITYTAPPDAAGNEADPVTRTVTVADTAPPVITLTGDALIVVTMGDTFTDPGFDVNDNDPNYAGTVTPTIRDSGDIEVLANALTDTVGTYIITYTADNDAAGNSPVAVTRTVTVLVANPIDRDNDLLIDIDTLEELNAMRHNLDGTSYQASAGGTELLCDADAATACIGYELLIDLDFDIPASYASGTVNLDWRPTAGGTAIVATDSATNAGWEPIGSCNTDTDNNAAGPCGDDDDTPFTARFEGRGFTITNLYARNVQASAAGMGLFGTASGAIEGIGIVNANIYGGAGAVNAVGGLVGFNSGTITASYATGNVDGGAGGADRVGGLIGVHATGGTITASYTTGNVDGGTGAADSVGGLVGFNSGAITASYATGNADGGADGSDSVGGLIGIHATGGTITASYTTGNVDGGTGDADAVGRLVGNDNIDTITASYGFSTATGEGGTAGVTRSDDASDAMAVANACAITQENSSTMTGMPDNRWDATQWDFGTNMQRPFVRHNGTLVPGQPSADRGC